MVWLIKLNFKVSDTSKFLTINTELSSIFDEKISPELTKIVHFIEFQKKFQVSQQETFEKLVMKKFDTLNARLDEVFDEVVTQQMARHKLNDLLASKVKSDSE